MHFDAAKGHLSDAFQQYGEVNATSMRPIPAESPSFGGRVERAIDFWKALFEQANWQLPFTKDDSISVLASMITWACNHLRKCGFAPYQFVLGRSPRVPTSPMAVLEHGHVNLSAKDNVLENDAARRAEGSRAAEWQRPRLCTTWTTTRRRGG